MERLEMRWTREAELRPGVTRLYNRALTITLAGNILLAVTKGIVAYLSGSVALFADTANSASDVVYSLLMVFGLRLSQRPPDISHPQGHSRFEPLVGLAVTFSMGFAGYEAARASIERLLQGGLAVEPGLPTIVLLFSAAVKLGMFWLIRNIARELTSPTLATTAKDNLSDVLTSSAAFIGAFGSKFISPLTDPIAGILVAAWIFRAAFMAGKENLGFLTGAGGNQEQREEMVKVAEAVPGVQRVHHLMAEYAGPKLVVDLHINVDGKLSLNDAHAIADAVIEQVGSLPDVDRVYVHVEPEGFD